MHARLLHTSMHTQTRGDCSRVFAEQVVAELAFAGHARTCAESTSRELALPSDKLEQVAWRGRKRLLSVLQPVT